MRVQRPQRGQESRTNVVFQMLWRSFSLKMCEKDILEEIAGISQMDELPNNKKVQNGVHLKVSFPGALM